MICTGFGFKVAAVPFHGWAPDVYEGAPTPVTAFMSVGIKAGAFAGIVRLFDVALSPGWDVWSIVLIVLAVLTMVVGNVLALPQRNLKRMLAYSSIAHAGYLLLGVIAARARRAAAGRRSRCSSTCVAYAFMNLGAFGVLVLIRDRRPFAYSLDEMAGLGRAMPVAALRDDALHALADRRPADGRLLGQVLPLRGRHRRRTSPGWRSSPC